MPRDILVVEDEVELAEALAGFLTREGYRVATVHDGEAALQTLRSDPPDLVLLDVVLPNVGGLAVCRELKEDPRTRDVPIIMLSARGEECDVVLGLSLGAEDYIVKPYRLREIVARIENVFRREKASASAEIQPVVFGDVVIDPNRCEVRRGADSVSLTATEMHVLHALASNPGRVVDRDHLLDRSAKDHEISVRNVDVHVRSIRKKLGRDRDIIQTVRGAGYRFREPTRVGEVGS